MEHDIPVPWPRERDVGTLVNLSSGLFIYANTVVRFIGDRDSLGPEGQLRAVLALATSAATGSSEHPLSELDLFYLLIMQRIPAKILQTVQWILLATTIAIVHTDIARSRQFLDVSPSQFHAACRTLHSVVKVEEYYIVFYHASFMEFIQDPQRSGQFCLWKDSALALRTELTQRLEAVCNDPDIKPYSRRFYALIRADNENEVKRQDVVAYETVVSGFFLLYSALPWDAAAFTALTTINFKRMAELCVRSNYGVLGSIDRLFSRVSHYLLSSYHVSPPLMCNNRYLKRTAARLCGCARTGTGTSLHGRLRRCHLMLIGTDHSFLVTVNTSVSFGILQGCLD
ncbi:hypothetical protein P691DRAFT_375827 [Macrolepiota fuliginosa MF-IS2]|uniref:Uncharacterized protein n=1 Tax=Macrolepiota fuliginosa MF-IS2 TaxID=1400762 RepID=A0A9P6BY81_9AGAR|nr:hypothetical protein P691DRAFT_375827 [Macrolepiota fuliginosa MF-IS2]